MGYPSILFELITAGLLALIPLYFLELRQRWAILPDRGLRTLSVFVLASVWLVVLYGSFIEPKFLTVKKFQVRLGDSGRTLRAAVISDIHLGLYRDETWTEKVVQRINDLKPDVVIIAGDLVSSAAGMREFKPFRELRSQYGTFAVLGNHDYRIGAVDVRKAIESYNVEVLTNESVPLGPVDGKDGPDKPMVRLLGLDDIEFGSPDMVAAQKDEKPGDVAILAVHNPDAVRPAEVAGMNLVISGHTHCGQIRLPFIGPIPKLPTTLGRKYDCGLFDVGPTELFISAGVGETGPRARLFDPPEIDLLEIAL